MVRYDGRIFQSIKSRHIGPVCRILEDRDGRFWFGSLPGSIIRYRVRHIPPRIRLLQVIADQVYENFDGTIRSATDQRVIFEYKGLDFSTHALSPRCDGPFIEVSCGALPVALIDSKLFGHEKEAFTNAVSHRLGRVELAESGTLFLDEIGDMALETQVKLLRLLQEGTFERVGSSETLTARTRIVAATNRNLEEMVGKGAFRKDLYYRLYAFTLYLPPLRERKEDIPALAELFKNRMATHLGQKIVSLSPEAIEALQTCDWPGNVRELEHAIQRAVVLCPDSQIKVENLGLSGSRIENLADDAQTRTLSASPDREIVPLDESERRYILSVLEATNWRIKGARGAAMLLGLPPSTLYGKMEKPGIKNHTQ